MKRRCFFGLLLISILLLVTTPLFSMTMEKLRKRKINSLESRKEKRKYKDSLRRNSNKRHYKTVTKNDDSVSCQEVIIASASGAGCFLLAFIAYCESNSVSIAALAAMPCGFWGSCVSVIASRSLSNSRDYMKKNN